MAQDTQKSKTGLIFVIAALIIIAGAAYFISKNQTAPTSQTPSAQAEGSTAQNDAAAQQDGIIDVEAALKDRVLGNPATAQIKISEHSSLTCGHCGNFHRTVFATFKREYIDSGKAYLVYTDFPLNAPALQASMVARCLPEDKFFPFINELFARQDDWAYDRNYSAKLAYTAGQYGMSKDTFNACIANEELRTGILAKVQAASQRWNIQSTPSFVVNNKVTLSGASSYANFDKRIQEALAQ